MGAWAVVAPPHAETHSKSFIMPLRCNVECDVLMDKLAGAFLKEGDGGTTSTMLPAVPPQSLSAVRLSFCAGHEGAADLVCDCCKMFKQVSCAVF